MASATGFTKSTSHCEGGGKGSSIVMLVFLRRWAGGRFVERVA